MPNMNKVILIGHLTRDPEVRHLTSGGSICNGTIAVSESWKDKSGKRKEKAAFIDFKIWGGSADRFAQWYSKGQAVALSGKLEQEEWADKATGAKRSKLTVVVDDYQNCGGKMTNVVTAGEEPPFDDEDVPL